MKCQVEGCTVERQDLSQHIRFDHQMTVKEYKEKYNVQYIIDESKRQKRGSTRRTTNQSTKRFKCEICGEACLTEGALYKHYSKLNEAKHSYILFNESNVDEWVQCEICGLRRSRIDFHLQAVHNMTKEEYFEKFNKPFHSKMFLERVRQSASKHHESERYLGSRNPFYSKHHSEESRKSIGETTKTNNSKLEKHFNKGRHHTEEACQKMSESRMGNKNPMFGKQPDIKTAFSIHGYRNDIGHSVRSTLEANYARYLIYNKIKYEFEPRPFIIDTDKGKASCWIDFYLIDTDEWVETKNYMGRDIKKIELTRDQYPTAKIKILYADSIEWRKIEKEYSVLIPLWETSVQNLRTHPSLYNRQ